MRFLFGTKRKSAPEALLPETEAVLAKLLKRRRAYLSCAESCTGGHLAHVITMSTALSPWFKGGIIAYSPEVKEDLLQVSPDVTKEEEAVNETCARAMLSGLLDAMHTNYGIAITGFAGPDGGTAKHPVGTVWIAAGSKRHMVTEKLVFGKTRQQNVPLFTRAALELLRKTLENE